MTVGELRDRIIQEAVASVLMHETREYRQAGCLEGLQIAEKLETPEDYLTVLEMRHGIERRMARRHANQEYWRYRCATAQIEFVWERLRIVWQIGNSFSANAFLHVARIQKEAR